MPSNHFFAMVASMTKLLTRIRERTRRGNWRDSWIGRHRGKLVTGFVAVAHPAGALTSVKAVMETRTSQGAIAWVISLNTIPYVAVPAYWVFGRSEFKGNVVARQADLEAVEKLEKQLKMKLYAKRLQGRSDTQLERFLDSLAHMPFTGNNGVELLIDGRATFDAIFDAIDVAESYVLVQFFIIKDDGLGNELKERLIRKAGEEVRVFVIYDELGS